MGEFTCTPSLRQRSQWDVVEDVVSSIPHRHAAKRSSMPPGLERRQVTVNTRANEIQHSWGVATMVMAST